MIFTPKKCRESGLNVKVMLTVFFYFNGFVHFEFFIKILSGLLCGMEIRKSDWICVESTLKRARINNLILIIKIKKKSYFILELLKTSVLENLENFILNSLHILFIGEFCPRWNQTTGVKFNLFCSCAKYNVVKMKNIWNSLW